MSKNKTQPVVLILAGPNGAGKSTLAQGVFSSTLNEMDFVNADTIAQGLSATRPESVAITAGRLMVERLQHLGDTGRSFAFETTLAGRMHHRFLLKLKASGYHIDLVYISMPSPILCVERIVRRVKQGGHMIPEPDVHRRYARSISNFFNLYQPVADTWQIWDNSMSKPRPVAMGLQNESVVFEESLYGDLQKQARK